MEPTECPSCGGSGGGPFGRPGSAWDTEDYVCPRCKGMGWFISEAAPARPGLRKAPAAEAADDKKSASQR